MNQSELDKVRSLLTEAIQIVEGDSQATLPGGTGPAEVGEYSSIKLVPGTRIVAERFWVENRVGFAPGANIDDLQEVGIFFTQLGGGVPLHMRICTDAAISGGAIDRVRSPADLGWMDRDVYDATDAKDRVQRHIAAGYPSWNKQGRLSSSGEIMVGGGPTVGKPT